MRKLTTGVIALLILVMIPAALAINIVKPAPGLRDVCGTTYNFSADILTAGSSDNVSFYWNNSGTLTALCSVANATIKDGTSYSCTGSTAGITEGAASIVAIARNATSLSQVEINLSAVLEVDNAGPDVTFASTSTADGNTIDKSDSLDIYVTSDEVLVGSYVKIAGKQYPLLAASETSWYYLFDETDVDEGSYTYSIEVGADNTSCATAGTDLSREIIIGTSKVSSAAGAATGRATQAQAQAAADAAQKTGNRQVFALAAAAVAVYLLFFYKKGKR